MSTRYSDRKRTVFLALLLGVLPFAAGVSWADPMDKVRVDAASLARVTTWPIETRYFHDFSTAQIEAMRHARFRSRLLHSPGMTVAEHELKTGFQIGGIRKSSGKYAVWADSITVDFSYTRMDVYISDRYPVGSCPYKVILGHENQHVAINHQILARYKALIEKSLRKARNIPTRSKPISVKSMEQGKAALTKRINGIVEPLYEQFKRAVIIANGKIDTTANYKKTQAKCGSWR